MYNELKEKTYLVTGATSGIGYALTGQLARHGARIIGVGRSAEKCAQSQSILRRDTQNERIDYLTADLSLQSEVRRLAAQIGDFLTDRGLTGLDGLVNNAGTFTYWCRLTDEGVETQWAVNHFAGYLLANALLPWLEAAPSGRVITVSSQSHFGSKIDWNDPQRRRKYNGLRVYGDTKLANLLFTLGFNGRLAKNSGVRADAVDPGLVNTEIGSKGTPAIANLVWKLRKSGGTTPDVPAAGIVQLLADNEHHTSLVHYWKNARPQKSSREALNVQTADRLWAYSQDICGL